MENARDDSCGLSETSDSSDTSDASDTRAGKLAVDALSIDLVLLNVLTSLTGYYRYKAVYSFMVLGLLSKKDADELFLQPAEIQYGPGGLKTLMQTCSAVLKLIRYEHGWLFCERSEDVLRHSVLDPHRAWVTLMHVVQIGLDPSIINAMISTYKIDVTGEYTVPTSALRCGDASPGRIYNRLRRDHWRFQGRGRTDTPRRVAHCSGAVSHVGRRDAETASIR